MGKENKYNWADILAVLQLLISLIPIFADLNQSALAVILTISFLFVCILLLKFIYIRKLYYDKYYKLRSDLKKRQKYSEKSIDYAVKIEEIREKVRSGYIKERNITFCILLFLMVFSFVALNTNSNSTLVIGNIKEVFGIKNTDSERGQIDNNNQVNQRTKEKQPDPVKRNKSYRFILDNPDIQLPIDDKVRDRVLMEGLSDDELEEWALKLAPVWSKGEEYRPQRRGVNYETVSDQDGNKFSTYSKLEDQFKHEVESAEDEEYEEQWKNSAPHSSKMEQYIKGRETLNQVEVDGKSGCFMLYWRLANDRQYLAQEYETQTQNASAIGYNYVNSADCCMQALQYAETKEDYENAYHYLVKRYQDIGREKAMIDLEIKKRAQKIYEVLVKYDTKE